jgi:dihydroxyacetone kinase
MRNSMIRGANDKLLHDLLETRTNAARSLTGDQLNEIQLDIESQTQNIQELYYQNTKNELLQKGYKNAMEISHLKAANTSLENNIIAQITNIIAHISQLESPLQALQQQNIQIMNESNEMRMKTFEHQADLELKIAQLE